MIEDNPPREPGMSGEIRPSLKAALIASNAGLYAAVGIATYFGLFAPIFGIVRFWPSVVIPAVYAVLFSPMIGALGAAIGIFISDMVIHGNAVLSLTVGVPANFLGFYLLGYLARGRAGVFSKSMSVILQLVPLILAGILYLSGILENPLTSILLFGQEVVSQTVISIVLGVAVAASAVVLAISIGIIMVRPGYAGLIYASSAGLMVGSLIIGVGVWLFFGLPLFAAPLLFLWTYLTEIPFLVILLPPIVDRVAKSAPERVKWLKT